MGRNKKEKKPSELELARRAIAAKYQREYDETPIITTANLGGIKTGFAAVAKDHVQVFIYDKDIKVVTSIAKYKFEDYTDVYVDHYAIKSVFEFKGSKEGFTLTPSGMGKEIESLIRHYTSIKIHKRIRKWYRKVIGFRSNKKGKMFMASLFYVFLFFTLVSALLDKDKTIQQTKEVAPAATIEADKDDKKTEIKPEKEMKQEANKEENVNQVKEEPEKPEVIEKAPEQPEVVEEAPKPEPEVKTPAPEVNVTYKNCAEVRAAGKAPIRAGQPGYSRKLDRDGDGIACDR